MRAAAQMFVAVLSAGQAGCGILGPSCLAAQKRGLVQSLSGPVQAGQVVTHALKYDERGSQNNIDFSWTGVGGSTGLKLKAFATGPECLDFVPPPDDWYADQGPCRIIGSPGGYLAPDARPCALAGTCEVGRDEIIYNSIIITGPGNGAPAGFSEYKLHVVGDARLATSYSVSVTWFYGPDC
jgi:hypothetical protein